MGDGKDLAVRVGMGVDRRLVQSQVEFVLGTGTQLRSPVPGLRWWRLAPLTEAEVWHVKDLIAQTGLQLAREELRLARVGPFRSAVFFAATGEPTKVSLDDGSWSSSAARLSPADPPPRRKPPLGRTPASRPPGPVPALQRKALQHQSVSLWHLPIGASPYQLP